MGVQQSREEVERRRKYEMGVLSPPSFKEYAVNKPVPNSSLNNFVNTITSTTPILEFDDSRYLSPSSIATNPQTVNFKFQNNPNPSSSVYAIGTMSQTMQNASLGVIKALRPSPSILLLADMNLSTFDSSSLSLLGSSKGLTAFVKGNQNADLEFGARLLSTTSPFQTPLKTVIGFSKSKSNDLSSFLSISLSNTVNAVVEGTPSSLNYGFSLNLTDPTIPSSSATPIIASLLLDQNQTLTAGLSKSFVFERAVTNVLEDRAKNIRNSIDVNVFIKKIKDKAKGGSVMGSAFWQLNRAVAVKATLNNESVGIGLFARAWSPSVVLSLIQHTSFSGETSFNLGFELDSGKPKAASMYHQREERFAEPETRLETDIDVTSSEPNDTIALPKIN